ncbi:MAG: cytochrome c556 [Cryomorphaceae bacterium]|jgi:cytochrome c556
MKRLSTLVIIVIVIWSCQEAGSQSSQDPEVMSEIKMAEFSELAKLMRNIHKDAKQWRSKIVNGEMVTDSVSVYDALVQSTPTKSEVKGPVFEGMAANYQTQLDAFLAAKDIDLAKSAYNNLVGACISCHQSYCPGPVKTIKKLYVPDS